MVQGGGNRPLVAVTLSTKPALPRHPVTPERRPGPPPFPPAPAYVWQMVSVPVDVISLSPACYWASVSITRSAGGQLDQGAPPAAPLSPRECQRPRGEASCLLARPPRCRAGGSPGLYCICERGREAADCSPRRLPGPMAHPAVSRAAAGLSVRNDLSRRCLAWGTCGRRRSALPGRGFR